MNAHEHNDRIATDCIAMIRIDRRGFGSMCLRARRFIGFVLVVGLHCCAGPMAMGQDRNYAPQDRNYAPQDRNYAPRDRNFAPRDGGSASPLKKLDLFQQSVKRKLKSALGVKESDPGRNRDDLRPMESPARDSPARYQNDVVPEFQQRPPAQYSNRRTPVSHPGNRIRSTESNLDLQPVVIPADGAWIPTEELHEDRSEIPRYPMRAVQYRQIPDRLPEPPGEMRRQLPPPVTDPPARDSPPGTPNYSGYRNPNQWNGGRNGYADGGSAPFNNRQFDQYGGQQAPAARGTVLGQPQVTATQHALRLIEENGDVKARLAGTDAENQRLKDKLAESQRLLARSTQAVESAHEEIDAMAAANRDLQKKLSDLESQHNRHLLETDRMLQTIREELDDVLVREISAKGR